jgi:hypothetical protein
MNCCLVAQASACEVKKMIVTLVGNIYPRPPAPYS